MIVVTRGCVPMAGRYATVSFPNRELRPGAGRYSTLSLPNGELRPVAVAVAAVAAQ